MNYRANNDKRNECSHVITAVYRGTENNLGTTVVLVASEVAPTVWKLKLLKDTDFRTNFEIDFSRNVSYQDNHSLFLILTR